MKCTINDIANVISESIPNPAESGYDIFVGLEHYDSGEVKITRYGSTDSLVTAVKVFKKGDILLARRNVYLKRAGLVDFDGVTSGDSIVLRVKPDLSKLGTSSSSVQKYLPFVLNTEEFWNYAEKYSDGTMSKRLSPKTLLQYEFEIPDDVDNRNDLLWSAFETKESYRTMIKAIDEMVKSQFIEMFGLPSANHKAFKIGCIADIVSDIHYGTSRQSVENGDYPYLRMNNITYTGELDLSDLKRISIPEEELSGCIVKKGDVLFNRTNSKDLVGKTCSFPFEQPMVIAGYIIRLRMNGLLLPEYLSVFLNLSCSKKMLRDLSKGAVGQANINAKEVQSITILIPPIELQNQFVVIKNQADKSKFELKQAIEKIDKVMRSLMQ